MAKRLHSIFTDNMDICVFTGCADVERHHVFGGANRERSEKYGFVVPLRPDLHPNGVRFKRTVANLQIDGYLKAECQKWYEGHVGTREEFIREFGKSYL